MHMYEQWQWQKLDGSGSAHIRLLLPQQVIQTQVPGASLQYQVRAEAVVARNRSPSGRCHHTATHHPAGRSVYVFGGYSSNRGHLNELWAFNLDHLEWWQPQTTGGCVTAGIALPCTSSVWAAFRSSHNVVCLHACYLVLYFYSLATIGCIP